MFRTERLDRAPTLTTDRLRLRAHSVDDLEPIAAMWANPDVVKYIGGYQYRREESWWRLMRSIGMWPALGFGYFVVEERSSGRFVGEVGVCDFQRDATPDWRGKPEAGWCLDDWCHGQGYGGEAVDALMDWARVHFADGTELVCMIDPPNVPSIRIADRVGFRQTGQTLQKGNPINLYSATV